MRDEHARSGPPRRPDRGSHMLDATVREAATRFGDAAAFAAQEGWALSFEELDRASDEAAAGLTARGVGLGDVVALALPSSPDYAVAYAALAKLGAVTVGLNPRSTGPERAAMVGVVAPRLVLATPDLAEGLAGDTPIEPVERADRVETILAGLRHGRAGDSPAAAGPRPRPPGDHRVDLGHDRHPQGRDVRRLASWPR